jgi:hypothetical protein
MKSADNKSLNYTLTSETLGKIFTGMNLCVEGDQAGQGDIQ